jgi:hypothetical protein
MSNIKFYTEEQVRKAIELSLLNAKLFIHKGLGDDKYFPTVYEALKNLTPIELPSDEYIDEVFQPMTELHQYYKDGFINGAKWMKEQILNQNK